MNSDLALLSGLEAAWPTFLPYLEKRIADLTLTLIDADNPEVRGRIKQLRDLKALPEQLRAQAVAAQEPQQPDEFA